VKKFDAMTRVWYVDALSGKLISKPIVKGGKRFIYIPRNSGVRNWRLDRQELETAGCTYAPRLHTTVYRSREMAEAGAFPVTLQVGASEVDITSDVGNDLPATPTGCGRTLRRGRPKPRR
jgi:hypothetical protein